MKTLAIACLLWAVSTAAHPENAPPVDSLVIGLLAGEMLFGENAGLDDAIAGRVTVGYRFNDRISGELAGARTATRTAAGLSADADLDTFGAALAWHYFRAGDWQPYLAAGIGQQAASTAGREHRATYGEGGFGLYRHLRGPFHFRAEALGAWSPDDDAMRFIVQAGLGIAFGGGYYGPGTIPH